MSVDKITACRAKLMKSNIGIASILLPLDLVERESISTMATDGKNIFYNPDFVNKHTEKEIEGVLLHEGCHVIWEHPLRIGNRNHELWNIATDFAINAWIRFDLGMELPEGGMLDKRFRGMSAEKIYDMLDNDDDLLDEIKEEYSDEESDTKSDTDSDCGSNSESDLDEGSESDTDTDSDSAEESEELSTGKYSSGSEDKYTDLPKSIGEVIAPTDDDGKPLDTSGIQEIAESIRSQVMMSNKLAGMGGGSSGLEGRIKAMERSQINWADYLQECLESYFRSDHTWSKPNKRHSWRGVHLPAKRKSDQGGEIAIAMDTSGSVSQQELNQMANECQRIFSDLGIEKVRVCYCDHVVRKNDNDEWWDTFDLSAGDEIEFSIRGRGGTEFDPVFNLLNDFTEDKEDIQALIYFTDGWADASPDVEPDIPVFWGITDPSIANCPDRCSDWMPFGEHIYVDCGNIKRW